MKKVVKQTFFNMQCSGVMPSWYNKLLNKVIRKLIALDLCEVYVYDIEVSCVIFKNARSFQLNWGYMNRSSVAGRKAA